MFVSDPITPMEDGIALGVAILVVVDVCFRLLLIFFVNREGGVAILVVVDVCFRLDASIQQPLLLSQSLL